MNQERRERGMNSSSLSLALNSVSYRKPHQGRCLAPPSSPTVGLCLPACLPETGNCPGWPTAYCLTGWLRTHAILLSPTGLACRCAPLFLATQCSLTNGCRKKSSENSSQGECNFRHSNVSKAYLKTRTTQMNLFRCLDCLKVSLT